MSTTIEQSASPWRKRHREDMNFEIEHLKGPRYSHFRLASESSVASEDDTESVYSFQGRDTDVIKDSSDVDTDESNGDTYEVEFEYEVASLSENDDIDISTTDSESMMLAAAAVICNNSLDTFVTVTDVEDSDDSSDEDLSICIGFSTCVLCKGTNRNPLYQFCEKCFQCCRKCNKTKTFSCFPLCQPCYKDRKKSFPPRPRRYSKKKEGKVKENAVKLDTLKNCLRGLSQDSGVDSTQDCPLLGLDQIVIPRHLQATQTSGEITSSVSKNEESEKPTSGRKRQLSESSLSDYEVKRPKLGLNSEPTSEPASASSTSGSFSSETSGFYSETTSSDKAEELCMFCHSAPKDSIFLHTNIAHCCCCYACAKKTLKSVKRCPICNRTVTKVVRIFTS